MSQLVKNLVNRYAGPLWRLVGSLIPKDAQRVAVNTFPDFDDTTRALAEAMRNSGAKLSVLTARKDSSKPAWLEGVDVQIAYRYSFKGLWLYHRARNVVFTHGCFSAWEPSSRQQVVNVWHGMPIKRIGLLDGKTPDQVPRFHYTIASDARFQEIMAAAFGVPKERVLVADHPRLDVLRRPAEGGLSGFPAHRRLVVWMPTYRASVVGDVRVDGDERASIFDRSADLARIDDLCSKYDALCIIKPHPMAKVSAEAFAKYRSLMLVNDQGLAERGLSLYQLLAHADLLITDVSSVYFDYQVLGRPTLLYCPDLRAYASTRGFVAPIRTLVQDEIIETEDELLVRLEHCLATAPQPQAPGARGEPSAARALLRQMGVGA